MHSKIVSELEQAMLPVKQAMEQRGLNINLNNLKELIEETSREKNAIESNLRNALGVNGEVNFNSSKDVGGILSEKLGVEPKRTNTGRISANRRILKGVNNPITDEICHYRDLEKRLSSLKAIYGATDKTKSKIYCTYIDSCPSGRLYTKDYSFQVIPETARRVIHADVGCSFILSDYDSFELRILSSLAHDTYFKECWSKGLDLHKKVVADMKEIPYDSVSDKQRKLGKVLNFGLAYGQEANGLARNLHISTEDAQRLMNLYKSKIPEIERFKSETVRKARATGFSDTHFGRRRFLPDITSPNTSNRKKAERQAVNHAIQGTAADIVKFSLVGLFEEGFAINTMVHDSILVTVPDDKVKTSLERVKAIMEIKVEGMSFPVTCKVAKTWGDCYKKNEM